MSIYLCTSVAEVHAIADPKQVTWVGPGNLWEVKTGADIDSPPQVVTSDPLRNDLSGATGSQLIAGQRQSDGAVIRSVQDKLYDGYVSVKDFGAVGNGLSDDTYSVQKAIDSIRVGGTSSGNGATLYFPRGIYSVSGLVFPDHITILGDGIDEYKNSAPTNGSAIVSRPGGSLVSAVIGETCLLKWPSFNADQVTMRNITVRNTHYQWAICSDDNNNYFQLDGCMVIGGSSVASPTNKNGIYFAVGYWHNINNTTFYFCGIGAKFGSQIEDNNNATLHNSKFSYCNIGVQFEYGIGASIISCSFESNLSWDIDCERERVTAYGNYFDGGKIKCRGVDYFRDPQINFILGRDYITDFAAGRTTRGIYDVGNPLIDRKPAWKFGSDVNSSLTLHCTEVSNRTKIGTREGEYVTISNNGYSLGGNGQIQYLVPDAVSSSIVSRAIGLAGGGISMSNDWTIGVAFYMPGFTAPPGSTVEILRAIGNGDGIVISIYGAGGASPGFMLFGLYKGGVGVGHSSGGKIMQGLNLITVSYNSATDTISFGVNGDERSITGALSALSLPVQGTTEIFKNCLSSGIYFVEFSAVPMFCKSADHTSFSMHGTKHKTIEAAHASVETLKVRRGINHAIPNVETLAGNKLLTTDAVDHQFLDGGIFDRVVSLPVPESATGRRFTIVNRSSSNSIAVKSASITVITIPASKAGFVISDGQSWLGALGV